MVNVCYLISHGFAARMVLHSDLVSELSGRGLTTAIITPNAHEGPMQDLAAELGVELHGPRVRQRLASSLAHDQLQRYVFENVESNPALYAKHLRELNGSGSRRWQRIVAKAMMGLNRAARRHPRLPDTVARVQEGLLTSADVEQQLRAMNPDVVVATYPANFVEATYLHQAQRLGIKTAAHLLSWDNITCKGRFPVLAEYHVAWGPIMSDELQEHYDTDPERIFECGVPHFDAHVRGVDPSKRTKVIRQLGLDPDHHYLFFGMSSPYFAPHEIDIVEWLARQVEAGAFGQDTQLVIRPHPQNVSGNMADESWLGRLQKLKSARVAVDIPRIQKKSRLMWNMQRDDLSRLATLLSGCAITINSGSTLCIDAMIHDRPVIITAFDADADLPWYLSARRCVEYPHLAKLVSLEGLRVARSFDELSDQIRAYLDDPATDQDGRARSRAQECGPCDGRAAARVADAFAELVERHSPLDAPPPPFAQSQV